MHSVYFTIVDGKFFDINNEIAIEGGEITGMISFDRDQIIIIDDDSKIKNIKYISGSLSVVNKIPIFDAPDN